MTTHSHKAKKTAHPWSTEALLAKAQRYAEEMLSHSRDDWRFGLTSTFVLEFLARASLANTSPALLADLKTWSNLYFSLGHTPNAPKFFPKSIDISEVFSRLRDINPAFTSELEGFAAKHISLRNEELHAGSTPFDGLSTNWLAKFYETCTVFLVSIDEELDLLFGDEESKIAVKLIAASKDESAKAVAKAISAHKTVWETKDPEEKENLKKKAAAWATSPLEIVLLRRGAFDLEKFM